jgi:glycosyltransferase involved in cell wall biosynthesis
MTPERDASTPLNIAIVAHQLPDAEGYASARALFALGEGLVADGHRVECWSWWIEPPSKPLPTWCEWRPLPRESFVITRARALIKPRADIVRSGWKPPDDAVALADDVPSFAAVEESPRSVATFHYLTTLDAGALGRRSPRDVQSHRAEKRVARRARLVTAYSERVGRIAPGRAVFVPIAYTVPTQALASVEEPVATMFANYEWPPNHAALASILDMWPRVRERVPRARLLIAGWHLDQVRIPALDGVEVIGAVDRVVDLLARTGLLVFPCPNTSGPKIKVIESLAHGVPVLTTAAGAEGIVAPPGVGPVVSDLAGFADAMAALLPDAERRAELGRAGREAIRASHDSVPAARARVAALRAAFG